MQWLYDELFQCLHREEVCDLVYKLEQKAKEMEREQIETAYQAGDGDAYNLEETKNWAKQYYNETYGGEK